MNNVKVKKDLLFAICMFHCATVHIKIKTKTETGRKVTNEWKILL